jgi:hypothetical protein
MPNPGPASTVTQESFAPMTNVVKGGVFPLTLTPAPVLTITTAAQNFANTGIGLAVGDYVSVAFNGAQTVGVGVLDAYVSAADQLTIRFVNPTAASVTPASGTYLVSVQRPSTLTAYGQTSPLLAW